MARDKPLPLYLDMEASDNDKMILAKILGSMKLVPSEQFIPSLNAALLYELFKEAMRNE